MTKLIKDWSMTVLGVVLMLFGVMLVRRAYRRHRMTAKPNQSLAITIVKFVVDICTDTLLMVDGGLFGIVVFLVGLVFMYTAIIRMIHV